MLILVLGEEVVIVGSCSLDIQEKFIPQHGSQDKEESGQCFKSEMDSYGKPGEGEKK